MLQDFGAREAQYDRFLGKLEARLQSLSSKVAPPSVSARTRRINASISLRDYIDRIVRGTNRLTDEEEPNVIDSIGAKCAVIAVEYVERASAKGLSAEVYKLFLTAFVIAFKYVDDFEADSYWWAHVSGLERKDISAMEFELCSKLDWNLNVSLTCFVTQRRKLALSTATLEEDLGVIIL